MIRFIAEHKDHREPGPQGAGLRWGVEPMCTVLSEHGITISPSTFYEWVTKQATRRQLRDVELVEVIRAQREDKKTGKFVQTLGARKMWIRLRGQGHDVARCTVERIMREQGWQGAVYGSKHRTTIPDEGHPRAADLVDRNFWAPAPNRLWVADFSYVPTWSGMVYVAFVIDVFSRRIVGWRAARSMTTSLVLDALEHALFTRAREGVSDLTGLVSHSDAGSQGGFKGSSQHLDREVERWGRRRGRSGCVSIGDRSRRRGGRRSRGERIGSHSGRRSLVA